MPFEFYRLQATSLPSFLSYLEVRFSLTLDRNHRRLIEKVASRNNVYFGGSAGTGKTRMIRLLKYVLVNCERPFLPKMNLLELGMTATTGLAATHIAGMTINSFFGLDIDCLATRRSKLLTDLETNDRVTSRVRRLKILFIDEISMMDPRMLDLIDSIMRHLREDRRPFGGVQIILSGDFLQLPPVQTGSSRDLSTFAFESEVWVDAGIKKIILDQVFRQRSRPWIALLERVRRGETTDADRETLRSRIGVGFDSDRVTCLYPLRKDVVRHNKKELARLPGTPVYIVSKDTGNGSVLDTHTLAPRVLELKPGAPVLLIRNFQPSLGLCNGARGVVVGFISTREVKRIITRRTDVTKKRKDPRGALKLRYLFLSRRTQLRATPPDRTGLFPVCDFDTKVGKRRLAVFTSCWQVKDDMGFNLATREQIPLLLSWSITIHKSQGMTLDRVKISLDRCRTHGQAYVALSRVRSLDGLEIIKFDPESISISEKALSFYRDDPDSER